MNKLEYCGKHQLKILFCDKFSKNNFEFKKSYFVKPFVEAVKLVCHRLVQYVVAVEMDVLFLILLKNKKTQMKT